MPLVPVTVTVTDPGLVKEQERVEVPRPPVTVVGVRVHATLSEDRPTSPVKLFRGDTAMVEVPAEPTVTETEAGFAARPKSGRGFTVKVTVAV